MKNIANTAPRVLAIAVSLIAGFFILFNSWNITAGQATGYGILAILLGVIYAGTPKPSMAGVFGLILLGAYALARATGKIEVQLLRYGLGLPLIFIGLWGVYSMLNPEVVESSTKESSDSDKAKS